MTPEETFEALARANASLVSDLGDRATWGGGPGLWYGAIGGDEPAFNRLMTARLEPVDVDRRLDDALRALDGYPSLAAFVMPGSSRDDLVARLAARGFAIDAGRVPAMRASLDDLPAVTPAAAVTLDWVTTAALIPDVFGVVAAAFEIDWATVAWLADLVGATLIDPSKSGRAVLARMEGEPVACAFGFVHDDVLGIYNVGTVVAARGHGLGSLVTLAVMHDGRRRGAVEAVLESSDAGHGLYRRLGFEDVGSWSVLVRTRARV